MAKELPYFQFEPAQYLTGTIQLCSYAAQGIMNNIESIYWQRECCLTEEQLYRKFNSETEKELIKELVKEKIIKIKGKKIVIDFLQKQFNYLSKNSAENSANGSKGAKKRWKDHVKKNSPPIISPLAKSEMANGQTIAKEENKENKKILYKINLEKEMLNSFSIIEEAAKHLKSKSIAEEKMGVFISEQKAIGTFETRTIEDLRKHYLAWVKKLPKEEFTKEVKGVSKW